MKLTVIACFFSILTLGVRAAELSQLAELRFEYQQLTGDFQKFSCAHEKASVGLFEWDVVCQEANREHRYFVHLVLNRYRKTSLGKGSYELLYWVTDMSQARPAHDSMTLWLHNSDEAHHMAATEASLGVEDDQAYLKLTLRLENLP